MKIKNYSLIFVLFIILSMFFAGCSNNHPKLKKIDKVKFHYVLLSDSTTEYIKNRSEYSEYLKDGNKKLVVYAHCDYCPYIKRIQDAVDELKQRSEYKDYYNFYLQEPPGYKTFKSSEDMKAFTVFFNKCNTFCIFNPKTNEMFTASGDRIEFALNLHYILDTIMYW